MKSTKTKIRILFYALFGIVLGLLSVPSIAFAGAIPGGGTAAGAGQGKMFSYYTSNCENMRWSYYKGACYPNGSYERAQETGNPNAVYLWEYIRDHYSGSDGKCMSYFIACYVGNGIPHWPGSAEDGWLSNAADGDWITTSEWGGMGANWTTKGNWVSAAYNCFDSNARWQLKDYAYTHAWDIYMDGPILYGKSDENPSNHVLAGVFAAYEPWTLVPYTYTYDVVTNATGNGADGTQTIIDDSGQSDEWLWWNGKTSGTYEHTTPPNQPVDSYIVNATVQTIIQTRWWWQEGSDPNAGYWADAEYPPSYTRNNARNYTKTIHITKLTKT